MKKYIFTFFLISSTIIGAQELDKAFLESLPKGMQKDLEEQAKGSSENEDPVYRSIENQTKLENGNAVNLFIGKSWKFYKSNTYLRLSINVNNVLDNTSFKTGGFEQLRYDASNIQRFPNKYGYMYGRTYFAMLSLSLIHI